MGVLGPYLELTNAPPRPKLAVTSTTNIIARYRIETKNERAALGILPVWSGCSPRSILQTVDAYQMLSPTTVHPRTW